MKNSSPLSVTHDHPISFYDGDNDDIILHPFPDQFFHQSSGGGGGGEDNNYNNLPDQPPSSTTFQPGQHVDPFGITSNPIHEDSYLFDQLSNPIYEDRYLFDQVSNPIYEDNYLFDQSIDQDWLSSSNIDYNFSFENYVDFDATPQTQDINHSQALLHGGGRVASQSDPDAKERRQYKRWTHEEMSKLLVAIYEFRQSRYMWTDVKNNHFSADIERSANSLKQKFKEMCKAAATSSGVKDPRTKELYNHALVLRGEIQQKKCFKKSFTGNYAA